MTEPSLKPSPTLEVAEGDAAAARDAHAFDETPQWPVTRLAAVSLTLALAGCMVAPAVVSGDHGARLLALLLPAALATVTARVLFESLGHSRARGLRGQIVPAVTAALTATVLLSLAAVIVGLTWSVAMAGATALLAGCALIAAGSVRDLEIRVRMINRRVYFVGAADARRDLEHELRRRREASFVGGAAAIDAIDMSALANAILASHATVLVLDREATRIPTLVEMASQLNLQGVHVRDLVGYYEAEFKKVPLGELSPTWFLFDIAPIHRKASRRIARRALECGLAAVLLLVTLPFLLVVAPAIRLTSPGPALYRQRRVGKGGTQFTLLKLRTMIQDERAAEEWAGSQGHRVTPIGRFLRRFRLDELPQLWNVLAGDLALVGPRPEQVPIVERLEREIPFYGARHCIRPGLTGWAQVNLGYSGSVEGTISKLQRDLYYIKHSSWRLDGLILWLTLKAVVSGRG
jgi:exopolysaccharide biosynthesis polyprenyl glycosylphosphotransferase